VVQYHIDDLFIICIFNEARLTLFDKLAAEAAANPRHRKNYDSCDLENESGSEC